MIPSHLCVWIVSYLMSAGNRSLCTVAVNYGGGATHAGRDEPLHAPFTSLAFNEYAIVCRFSCIR